MSLLCILETTMCLPLGPRKKLLTIWLKLLICLDWAIFRHHHQFFPELRTFFRHVGSYPTVPPTPEKSPQLKPLEKSLHIIGKRNISLTLPRIPTPYGTSPAKWPGLRLQYKLFPRLTLLSHRTLWILQTLHLTPVLLTTSLLI